MEEKIYMPKDSAKKKKEIVVSIVVVIIIAILALIIGKYIKQEKYKKTYEYKLIQIGYTKEEAQELEKVKDLDLDYILTIKKDDNILKIVKEKYYLNKNLKTYLDYIKEHSDKTLTDVVAIVNVKANNDWYTNTIKSDTKKDLLILVNKFYTVDETYEPDDLVNVKNWYYYGENQRMREEAYNEFISMYNAAQENNIKIIINSSYRPYTEQKEIYDQYLSWYGQEKTDALAAHPGSSEHQTGLAIDVFSPGYNSKNFEESEAFKWLTDNAYKYGYILRYPKDKEYLTGYDYESWHYRYVGKEVAEYIQKNHITFDEYYAYYLDEEKEVKKGN